MVPCSIYIYVKRLTFNEYNISYTSKIFVMSNVMPDLLVKGSVMSVRLTLYTHALFLAEVIEDK